MSNRERMLLIQRVQELGPTEHEEIFNMVRDHGVDYMENNNGIFVDLATLDDELLRRIAEFVSFCMSNNHRLDEYDKTMNECKLGLGAQSTENEGCCGPSAVAAHAPPTISQGAVSDAEANAESSGNGVCAPAPPPIRQIAFLSSANTKYMHARKRFSKRKDRKVGREDWNAIGHDPATAGGQASVALHPEPYVIA